jgi:hypothetical protein
VCRRLPYRGDCLEEEHADVRLVRDLRRRNARDPGQLAWPVNESY